MASAGRERLAWLVTVPIAVLGSEAAHMLGNAAFGSAAGPSGELLDGTGPGAGLAPDLTALALVIAMVGLAARALGAWGAARPAPPIGCALLPPAIYVFQEHLEAALHGGVPLTAALDPTFLPGLALQLPFALAVYLLARALIGLADGVRGLLARRRPAQLRPARTARRPGRGAHIPASLAALAHRGRGPPLHAPG